MNLLGGSLPPLFQSASTPSDWDTDIFYDDLQQLIQSIDIAWEDDFEQDEFRVCVVLDAVSNI